MLASTQKKIREDQHANEVENTNGTATSGGGVSDSTSKGRLTRQIIFTTDLLVTISLVNVHPSHLKSYTWCFTVPVPHGKTCSEP